MGCLPTQQTPLLPFTVLSFNSGGCVRACCAFHGRSLNSKAPKLLPACSPWVGPCKSLSHQATSSLASKARGQLLASKQPVYRPGCPNPDHWHHALTPCWSQTLVIAPQPGYPAWEPLLHLGLPARATPAEQRAPALC